ncbi:MAG: nucleotide exchange factor GrpE [Hyphomicrobium sp.]
MMSDPTKNAAAQKKEKSQSENPQEREPFSEPAEAEAAPPEVASEPGPEQLKEIIAALQTEIEQQKNQTLRVIADMDNLRKRTEREKEDIKKYAITKFAADLINGIDNFERALGAVPKGAAEADPALASLMEGVGMTERELKSILERHGVKRIWPEGEMLNPHYHQAVMEQHNPDVTAGTILQVYQAGYLIEDRVLRAAMVVVAKGGEKKSDKSNSNPTTPKNEPPSGAHETQPSSQ